MRRTGSSSSRKFGIGLLVVLVLGAGGWFGWQRMHAPRSAPPAPDHAVTVDHAITVPAPASARTVAAAPAPAPASTAVLPALEASDEDTLASLLTLFGEGLRGLVVPDELIRRIVATVDALPRTALPVRLLPLRTPPGAFRVNRNADGTLTVAADNAQRYAPYVQLAERADPQAVAAWYTRHYPLFQQAYRELGYPHGEFHQRLLTAIDDLLAAPEPRQPPTLVQPKVYYAYADPALESLSAGQKLMIRMGPDNEARLKAKLRALRAALVQDAGTPAGH
ncbi:DUF3014 domain-containing protein [Aerosticca soli]|nr:DUF3014 domain-containing protein [Aerosticca soli]